jgi:hypothetical protein
MPNITRTSAALVIGVAVVTGLSGCRDGGFVFDGRSRTPLDRTVGVSSSQPVGMMQFAAASSVAATQPAAGLVDSAQLATAQRLTRTEPVATTLPAAATPPLLNRRVVDEYTVISTGGTASAPLVLENVEFRNGLRIVANHVLLRNSTVTRPKTDDPTLYINGNFVTVEDVVVGGPGGSSEGLRLEGGDRVTLRRVSVPGLQFQSPSAHSDAIQVHLLRNLTNLLIEDSAFDGTVYGDPSQATANGSQFDGRGGVITGTIRNTSFAGGKYYSARYYNIGGPLVLERVTYSRPMITNSPTDLIVR